jgi:hypothetical protein
MARIDARRRSRGMRPLPSATVTTGGSAATVPVTSIIEYRRGISPYQCHDHHLQRFTPEEHCLPQLRHAAAHPRPSL